MRIPNLVCAIGLVAVGALPAAAQERRGPVPAPGMVGVGASFGASIPTDDRLKTGPEIGGTIEGYLTRRVSIRGRVGATWEDFKGQRFSGTLKPVYFDAGWVYTWEGAAWHPDVAGGAGIYRFNYEENGIKGHDTAPGFNLGGGLEYFFTRRSTITGDVLYRRSGDVVTALAPFEHPSWWTIGLGLKHYF